MIYNFDEIVDRINSDSAKWGIYDADVLPMWVADMDFVSPKPVVDALHERISHGVFGYPLPDKKLKTLIVERLDQLYGWNVKQEEIVFLPGVVNGFNNAIQSLAEPGQNVLMQTPVYPPFLTAPENGGYFRNDIELFQDSDGIYQVDFEKFERAVQKTTGVFLLCNPHNPIGRVFNKQELSKMAEICLSYGIPICSDEIHCDLLFDDHSHIPIASISPEISQRTITLMAPSKTYNIAGLECAFAIIQNPFYLKQLEKAGKGLVSHVNILGYSAATAAYEQGQEWLDQLISYLTHNRDFLVQYIEENIPQISVAAPQGTYLAWLDCKKLDISNSPYDFFLKKAKVALNDGVSFGNGGKGFVRLNFGCPKSILVEGLDRMRQAVENRK